MIAEETVPADHTVSQAAQQVLCDCSLSLLDRINEAVTNAMRSHTDDDMRRAAAALGTDFA